MPATTDSLFRAEALAHLSGDGWGDRLPLAPPSGRLLTGLLCAAVAAVAVFLATGTYPRTTTLGGFLDPVAGSTPVPAPVAGVIDQLQVVEGDRVAAGDVLAGLQQGVHLADGRELAGAGLARVAAALSALERDAAGAAEEARLADTELQRREASVAADLAGVRQRRTLVAEQVRLATAAHARARDLAAQGVLAQAEVERLRAAELAAVLALADAEAREREALDGRARLRAERALAPAREARRAAGFRRQRLALEAEQADLQARHGRLLRAPVAGRVSGLRRRVGDSLAPGDVLLHIVPEDSALQAVLWVPARDAGFVAQGQAVRVRYDAFPHQRFGAFDGQVVAVATVVDLPEEQRGAVRLAEPAFRVRVALDRQQVVAYGQRLPLRAGMTLQGDVVAERRSLLQWLLDPLRALGGWN